MKNISNTIKYFVVLFLSVVILPVKGQDDKAPRYVEIEITPNHDTWDYEIGENAIFAIKVKSDNLSHVAHKLTYYIGAEKMPPTIQGDTLIEQDVLILHAGTLQEPGFMTCRCEIEVDGRSYSKFINVAFAPHQIVPTQTMPDDFDAFWQESIKKASRVPLTPLITLMPEKCTERTNVYHVRLQHWRKDTYIYGWLCIPKKPGRYPAVLCVPGAGVKPVPAEIELAEMGEGLITFSMGVNGIPLNLTQEVYDNLRYGVLRDYGFIHLDNKEYYYYRRIYTACVRAVDFINSLAEYDGENLGVMGGSQGGALSIVTASLDKRVRALVAFYPALCDVTGYLHNRAGGWPHIFATKNMPLNNTPDKIITTQYYDVVNFARRLQVPGYYSWGYNDPTCPPTSFYAAYNEIKAPKTLFVVHETGHWRVPEQNDRALSWLYQILTQHK